MFRRIDAEIAFLILLQILFRVQGQHQRRYLIEILHNLRTLLEQLLYSAWQCRNSGSLLSGLQYCTIVVEEHQLRLYHACNMG